MQDIKPSADSIHKAPQKSKTLNRKYTKKPVKDTSRAIEINQNNKKVQTRNNIVASTPRSNSISHFGKKPLLNKPNTVITPSKNSSNQSVPANSVHINNSSEITTKPAAPVQQKSAKEKEIEKALNAIPVKKKSKKKIRSKTKKRFTAWTTVFIIFFIAFGVAYYFSAPAIALHLANNQAGINARYPSEKPEGFKIDGPAKYVNGSVTMTFTSKSANQNFAITQTKTKWDTTKLKDEVKKISNDNFTTTEYKGLTIFNYTLNGQIMTTWVNSDILYVLSSHFNLDPSQIRILVDGLN